MRSDQLAQLSAALSGRYTIGVGAHGGAPLLGEGGMAAVYLADDVKHQRKVALKVLRPELSSALGPDRFLREIAIAARLNHPHIVPLFDSGQVLAEHPERSEGSQVFLYYVMPYIKGESLRRKLTREHQLPIAEAIAITRQVAAALTHAHDQGIIHRDIKPENILLYEGEAMVADFGIALAVSAAAGGRLTETGMLVGTPQYMSPEQAMGDRELDARSDVYALGCVLYEMLAGEPPFTGPTAQSIFAKLLTDPVPPVRRLRDAVAPGLEQALLMALARAPGDRFASATEFAEALTRPAAPARARSVAVLPFQNFSPDPENEYFADGITEDVIAQLSKIRALKVISRTSVMQFKKRDQGLREIGAQLGAATLLEGSVRRAGDRVRIVAQLIDAESDQHLWAETYDRQLTDIFAIQSDVALQIAAALEAELSPEESTRIQKEPTRDLQAYQLYLQGRHFLITFTQDGMSKGLAYFEQAIQKDPNYALAYAAIALTYLELGETGHGRGSLRPDEAFRRAKVAVDMALERDAGLGEAHSARAYLMYVRDYDWAGAEREFKRALELNPNGADIYDIYGRMLSALGRFDEALDALERAQQLDPLAHRSDLASALLRSGRYDEGLAAASHGVELMPGDPRGHATLGWAYLLKGMNDQGVAELEQAVSLSPGATLFLGQLGQAYGRVGRVDQAWTVVRQMEELSRKQYVSAYHFAYAYTGLEDSEKALDWLERAYEERAGAVTGIKGSFLFVSLREHSRFKALLKKMNLL